MIKKFLFLNHCTLYQRVTYSLENVTYIVYTHTNAKNGVAVATKL